MGIQNGHQSFSFLSVPCDQTDCSILLIYHQITGDWFLCIAAVLLDGFVRMGLLSVEVTPLLGNIRVLFEFSGLPI